MQIKTRKQAENDGDHKYYTGKPCKHGHLCERFVSTRKCMKCSRVHCFNYHWANQEKEAKRRKSYRENNKESEANYKKVYYAKNKEKERERYVEYCKKNKKHISDYNSKYHLERSKDFLFLKKKRENAKSWRLANKERCNLHKRAKRNSLRASGPIKKEDITTILKSQNYKCANSNCLSNLKVKGYHLDHIMPVKLGGTNEFYNLQCLCPNCNQSKSCKHPIDWANENGLLL